MCVTFLFQTSHGFLFISEETTFYLGWQGFPEATPTPTPWGTDPTDLFVPWTCKLFLLCSLDLSAGTQPPHFYAMLKLVIQSAARMSSYSSLVFPSYLKLSSHSVKWVFHFPYRFITVWYFPPHVFVYLLLSVSKD